MRTRLKAIAANSLVVVVSTILVYLALELVFFRVLLTGVHLPVRPWLPETAGVMVQTTKSATVPRHYVAILGDSYAEGIGEALLMAGDDDSRGFHAAHVIHEMTNRDVVSFGKGGAGSAEAFVLLPSRALKGSQCLIFPAIEDPDEIIAYFYEGNDLEDNLRFADKVRQKYGRVDAAAIDAYLSGEYARYQWWRCHLHLGDVAARIVKFLHLYYSGQMNVFPSADRHPNALLVADGRVEAPPMPGPALELSEQDIVAGMQVLARSLAWLHSRFPRARIDVVAVPSPLSLYRHAGAQVEAEYLAPEMGYTSRAFAADRVAQQSKRICALARDIAAREGVGFIDPAPQLRAAAAARALHGPHDWDHFNAIGYRAFGEVLARRVSMPAQVDPCA